MGAKGVAPMSANPSREEVEEALNWAENEITDADYHSRYWRVLAAALRDERERSAGLVEAVKFALKEFKVYGEKDPAIMKLRAALKAWEYSPR